MKSTSLDKIFRAFADQNRLRILSLLSKGELCVCDIMDVLKMPQPKVSRHLAYLRNAGLVSSRKEGLWIYYELTKPIGTLHSRLLSCLDSYFDEVPTFERDQKALKDLKQQEKACC